MDTTTTSKSEALYSRARKIGETPAGQALRIVATAQMTFEADREEIVRLAAQVARNAGDIADAIGRGEGTPTDFVAQKAVALADYLARDRGNVQTLLSLARLAREYGVSLPDEDIF